MVAGTERQGVNASAIKGEPGTGFEKEDGKGEFECGNCRFFKNGDACHQEDMKEKSKQPRHQDGSVIVADEDCCEYVDRVGPKRRGWKSAGSGT